MTLSCAKTVRKKDAWEKKKHVLIRARGRQKPEGSRTCQGHERAPAKEAGAGVEERDGPETRPQTEEFQGWGHPQTCTDKRGSCAFLNSAIVSSQDNSLQASVPSHLQEALPEATGVHGSVSLISKISLTVWGSINWTIVFEEGKATRKCTLSIIRCIPSSKAQTECRKKDISEI